MNVICFGDSNTYGYDPRSLTGDRYPADSRWVDILGANTGWNVTNMGHNGRRIPSGPQSFPENTDLLIVMLGTNDLLQGCGPEEAAGKLRFFISSLQVARDKIFLIAPPPMAYGDWVSTSRLIEDSHAFAGCCQRTAADLGVRFADAGDWNISLAYDGVHFTEQGHRAFAAGLLKALK